MLKFYATIEFLSGQRAAILTLTSEAGEWAGSGRIELRPSFTGGVRAALYEEAYRQASLNASSKGGRLERFSVVRETCPSRRELAVERRPGNALNVEIGAGLPRCVEKTPDHWPDSMSAARWTLSGGDVLVFGVCAGECPK